ncbi:MAG: polysaccharide biosynthesis tyrosine autokinase [Chloroflexota bacterium]|nr:MAG: polysaccharide biosynthesis tyrosine autokinase [Chloroflexota bacterium]
MARNGLNGHERLVTFANPRSPAAEAYRQLRTNIQFSSLDRPLKTLLVTSTSPEEGKSTTLANLAITIAQTGNKVLIVDCDLRRPTVHSIFGITNSAGLTSAMVDTSLSQLPTQEVGIPNLLVLPSGPLPPNPSELLGSHRMQELMARLRESADYVLFDSPPVLAVTDAAVLASKLDGVLLVVNAGHTKREMAKKAKAALDKVNANIVGVVLNNVKYDTRMHHYFADGEKKAK